MAPYKKPIYYTVYDWMVTDCNLKGGAERDVYALLYSLADNIGVAKVSLGYLAERTGYTDRGVKKAILNLIEAGWIMKARTSHYGVNEYGIVEPASIIGRFDKSKITEEQSSRDIQKTSEQSSPEQRNIVPMKTEQSSPDTPYIYNFYNKIYNNFFITDDPSEKKEKEILLEEFFINFGLYQPMDEVMRFWAYHEQTGWKNGKGQKIVSKKSASHFWKIDETTGMGKERGKKKIHPHQKPIELYEWLLQNYAKQGDTIFDPNLGSGSSRIAAYNLGFDFCGCEIDRTYFALQEERFSKLTTN